MNRLFWLSSLFLCTVAWASPMPYKASLQSYTNQRIPQNAVGAHIATLHIQAHEDIAVSEIHVWAKGLVTSDDFENAWIETSTQVSSFQSPFFNDNTSHIRFRDPIYISKNEEISFDIFLSLRQNIANRNFSLDVQNIVLENKNHKTTPITLLETQQTTISGFEAPEIKIIPLGSDTVIPMGRTRELARFQIQNTNATPINLKNIQLENIGTANLHESFSSLSLIHQNTVLANASPQQNETITWEIPSFVIERNQSATFQVSGQLLYAQDGKTLQFQIKNATDIKTKHNDQSSYARIISSLPVSLSTHTLRGGGLFTRPYRHKYSGLRRSGIEIKNPWYFRNH